MLDGDDKAMLSNLGELSNAASCGTILTIAARQCCSLQQKSSCQQYHAVTVVGKTLRKIKEKRGIALHQHAFYILMCLLQLLLLLLLCLLPSLYFLQVSRGLWQFDMWPTSRFSFRSYFGV